MDVAKIQRALIALGYDLGTGGPSGKGDDGRYGPKTKAATRLFQIAQGLQRTDGVIDGPTEDALLGKKPAPTLPNSASTVQSSTLVTVALLRKIAPTASAAVIEPLAPILSELMPAYEITTPLRLAHFLAQACHETDGFATLEEYASGAKYEGRKDLGNVKAGDGRRFKGRGIFQITGRDNYATFGAKVGVDLIASPTLAATPRVSAMTALEYWKAKGLNAKADRDDGLGITKAINGGTNGLEDRKARLAAAKAALAGMKAAA